jgi:cadmium resistance protein CadD (predicted permease)
MLEMTLVELASIAGVAIPVFVSTNIDDIVILSVFFADRELRPRSIVLGQFLGIGALVAASSLCALAALAVPEGWSAVLGIAPLGLGLWKLRSLRRDEREEEAPPAERRAGSQALAVALVTLANGGDNLGVYIPLFARQPAAIPIYAAVFAVMTALWCSLGYALVNNRLAGERIGRYGRVALPFVLIALGIYILAGVRVLFV